MRSIFATAAALAALVLPSATEAPAGVADPVIDDRLRSTADQRESVAITVYNQNFGLVREIRTLDLGQGRIDLEFADVASGIQPETVHIRPLGGPGMQVLEQNYQYDLLNPQKLLEKYVGRRVTVYRPGPNGTEEPHEAEVLSVNGGPILRIDGEITYDYPGRFGFPELPDNLIAEPTLLWKLDAGGPRQRVEVTYLTNSLNWKSDYVLVLDEDDAVADLTGWVTLVNQSGATYEGAQLQLVAGDVQRVSGVSEGAMRARMMADVMPAAAERGFTEDAFFEYHLYTLQRPADVVNNEQKQVVLLEAEDAEIEKRLIFHGLAHYYRGQHGQISANQKVGVYLDFENSERAGLGMPLPKGTVRVYKRDASGAQQFVGEDRIDHTPRDEEVRIKMGEAFDVVADRRQMDYTVISGCVSESTWRVDIRNHKDEDVTVTLIEPVGGDWEIVSSTHRATKVDAFTFAFDPRVESRGETTVEYRVRVRWC
ncbi:MAG: DUF4139 domain-containing protein [Gemmatimonadota bacterium]